MLKLCNKASKNFEEKGCKQLFNLLVEETNGIDVQWKKYLEILYDYKQTLIFLQVTYISSTLFFFKNHCSRAFVAMELLHFPPKKYP